MLIGNIVLLRYLCYKKAVPPPFIVRWDGFSYE